MGSQMTVTQLLDDIKSGELILPEFQRGYVWNKEQVKEYLASLYRGYPTGSFLIWKTPNPGLIRGGGRGEAANVFQLILDGQQRLTSIYTLVNGEPPPFYEGEALFFNVHFNVRTEEFQYYKKTQMQGQVEWLPVTKFLQLGLGEYLGPKGPCTDDERAFLFEFFPRLSQLDKIRSYSYYLDTLGELEMEEVVRIFNLVNKQGTPLTKADLAMSHICAIWPEARGIMRAAKDEHEAAGFDFDLNFYVRCTAAVGTESGMFEPVYRLTVGEVQAAWHRAKKALDYLIGILKGHAFIDSSQNLSSRFVLVPLVVHLANGSQVFRNEQERREFLHWMYAAMMWSRYSGTTETKLNQDLQALKAPDPAARLREAIVSERGRIRVEGRDLINASTQTAFSTMAFVVARARGAVDWVNGLPLYNNHLGRSNGLEYHHIFPVSLLYKGKYDANVPADRNRVNEIANIAYLTQQANAEISNRNPAAYLPEREAKYPGSLAAQSVPMNPALWDLERYEDFIAVRRELIAGSINQFMDSLLVSTQPQQWTVTDYIAQGEGEGVEFKMSLRWDYKQAQPNKSLEKVAARTLAAFMNSKGGTLVIGVTDDGSVVGIDQDLKTLQKPTLDGWELQLRNVLNSYLGKEICAMVEVTFAEVDGKTVAVLRAERELKPVFLTDQAGAEFHVRSGNTSQLLDVKAANAYIAQHFTAAYA